MTIMERVPPWLFATGVLIAGFVVGGLLVAMDVVLVGVIVAAAAVPVAFVAWIMWGDRY